MTLTADDSVRLRSKIQADPLLADYARTGRDADILAELNRPCDAIRVPRGTVPSAEFDALLEPADRPGLSDLQLQHLAVLLAGGQVDLDAPSVLVFAETILADMPASRSRILAARTRAGCWAEQSFGRPLTVDEVSDALRIDRPDGRVAL